jgi:hypothetical protein
MTPMDGLRLAMMTTDAYYKQQGIFQGKELESFDHDAGQHDVVRFSPDGKTLALSCGYNNAPNLSLWDIAAGKRFRVFAGVGTQESVEANEFARAECA